MSIAVLGGLDRLKRIYEDKGKIMGVQVRVFSQQVPNMAERLSGVNGIVIFTGTVAHSMVAFATRVARQNNIPVGRSHSSGVSALKRCLNELSLEWSGSGAACP